MDKKVEYVAKVDIDNLLLNENAYFYKRKRKVTKEDILKLFDESITDKNATRKYKMIVRESLFDGSKEVAKYSLDIFQFDTKPSFLAKAEPGKIETKYGLFLILEYKDYLAVIRRNVSGVKTIKSLVDNIDYDILAHFLITNRSKFEKIVSSSMNPSETALQVKTSEAPDLKGVLSRFGISKQIISRMRLDNSGVKHSVALGTSRINSFQLKNSFLAAAFWMVEMLRQIDNAFKILPASPFIAGFAKPLKFNDVIDELTPTYVLLRFGSLKDEIEDGRIERYFRKDENDKEVEFDLPGFINSNEKLFKLTKVNDDLFECNNLKVKKNKSSITVFDLDFKSIYLKYGDDHTITLNQYLNNGSNFMVNFDKIDHVYSHGRIFKDSKLLGDIDTFLDTFIVYKELEKIKKEKGTGFKATDVSFSPDTLFGFIENTLATNAECLICDDLGVEWGDFIQITEEEIAFYHAKSHNGGLSASNFEEVFGQAQKNFGSLELTEDKIDYRKKRWLKQYKIKKVQTSIDRIRKSPTGPDKIKSIKDLVNSVSSKPYFQRKVYVVVNFLSKSELSKSIKELKKGNDFHHKGVTLQILWFVNSILCSSNELNVEFKVICKP